MSRVLAALDNSPATRPVLDTARALAALFGSQVEAVHVNGDGGRVAEWVARASGLPLHRVPGPLVEALIKAGLADDVVAMVVGARSTAAGPHPLGSTAFAVATSLPKPVVVVPPDARVARVIRRVLVPVEGVPISAGVRRLMTELVHRGKPDIIAVYVNPETDLPAFSDQPQHERLAWQREFILRYCDWHPDISLRTRVGRPEELIPLVAGQVDPDLIALSWSQRFGPGRAPVVRAVLERCRRPTLLVPVDWDAAR